MIESMRIEMAHGRNTKIWNRCGCVCEWVESFHVALRGIYLVVVVSTSFRCNHHPSG